MNRNPTLCREFVNQAKAFLALHPQITHTWSIDADEDHCILDIPEPPSGGFFVTVEVQPDEIVVSSGGAHTNTTLDGSPKDLVAHVLGYVRDLLSPAMRVRELSAGGSPYKWVIELSNNGKWEMEESVSLIFWNYFGNKSERIYQNTLLPAREWPVTPKAE